MALVSVKGSRKRVIPFLSFCVAFLLVPHAWAHRLDEYLQATQISVGRDRIVVDIYLTPGTAVAPAILGAIDTNGDGLISDAEGTAYALSVLKSIRLLVDDKPRELSLSRGEYPPMDQMSAGIGMIHLNTMTSVVNDREGAHTLVFENNFDPGSSVYLANAMLPRDRIVTIGYQQRDLFQRYLQIDYRIGGARPGAFGYTWILLALVGAVGSVRYWLYRSAAAARISGSAPLKV